jgi:hypothetical protein
MRIRVLAGGWMGLWFAALAGCTGTPMDGDAGRDDAAMDSDPVPVTPLAHWELNREGPNRFLLPWPSDLALTASGHLDLRYIPNDVNNALIQGYVSALEGRIRGFSPVAATYFRFSVPLDPATLPANVTASREAGSSVQLLDVDPDSPERGRRHPVQVYFRTRATRYWTANTLAVAPAVGFPLRPHTRYALVLTDALRAADGATLARDRDLTAVLATEGGDEAVVQARALHAPSVAEIERSGLARERILSMAVFTTQDPTEELFRAVEVARTYSPAPAFVDIERRGANDRFTTYAGHYGPNPVFQTGAAPYDAPGSGDFESDETGRPRVQRPERIAFALTVPTGTPPAGGWPVAIYAHGTGGNAQSFISDGTAASLAAEGIAVFGFDQIFNGERIVGADSGGTAEAQFFNFQNPLAGRNNNRQAALDLVVAGRVVRSMRVPAETAQTTDDVTFDARRVMFFGHSQGGLNGPLWLAADEGAGAAVLSGAGGTLTLALTQKTEPVNIPRVLAVFLGISTTNPEELVPLHPVLAMAQSAVDVADPVNYARYIVREPRAGQAPRHVYMTQGFVDHYTPPDSIGSLALAIGLPLIEPVLHPVGGYSLTGLGTARAPVQANLADGRATGIWQQFDAARGRDGHFVVFDIPAARQRAASFLGSYARDPAAAPTVQ